MFAFVSLKRVAFLVYLSWFPPFAIGNGCGEAIFLGDKDSTGVLVTAPGSRVRVLALSTGTVGKGGDCGQMEGTFPSKWLAGVQIYLLP